MSEESPATPAVAADAGDSRAAATDSQPDSTAAESAQKVDDNKTSEAAAGKLGKSWARLGKINANLSRR